MDSIVTRIMEVGHPRNNQITTSSEFSFRTDTRRTFGSLGNGLGVEAVFSEYDRANSGYITKDDVLYALAEMGAFVDVPLKPAGDVVARTLKVSAYRRPASLIHSAVLVFFTWPHHPAHFVQLGLFVPHG
eukprot:1033337-Pyramimonas_sp.AAC.1